MSSPATVRYQLISGSAVFMIIFGLMAWSSNPDEASFRRFASREAAQGAKGPLEQVTVRLLSQVALKVIDWEYVDYGFCSVVSFPGTDSVYVGAFGGCHRAEPSSKKAE